MDKTCKVQRRALLLVIMDNQGCSKGLVIGMHAHSSSDSLDYLALLLALVGACIAFTMEISSVESETTSFRIENMRQQFREMILELEYLSNVGYLQLNDTVQELSAQLSHGLTEKLSR